MHSALVVLGGGPGGYAAAFLAADLGMEVTLVEAEGRLGGTCLLRGCIPSKALLHVARVVGEVNELSEDWGVEYAQPSIDIDKVRARKEKVIKTLANGLKSLAKARKVNVVTARGFLQNSTTLQLEGDSPSIPEGGQITFDHLILATGSAPVMPPAFQIDSTRVMDSSGALDLEEIPKSLLVVGGGYIGLEMGSAYARLGADVSVVEMTDQLLPGADRDLVRPLAKRLKSLFENRIFLNTKVNSVSDCGDQIEVEFEGDAKTSSERFDRVLVSVGRRPSSLHLGLENTSVKMDTRGFVVCDSKQRTTDPHILAIGDVAGEPMLAHKAAHEAKVAVEALAGEPAEFDKAAIPSIVFTDPEIAWAGVNETRAELDEINVDVAVLPWAASGRAQAIGRTEGSTKWIIDPESKRVLGCGIVGCGAGELIAEAALAIEMGCVLRDVIDTVHPHPTLSETLMNAAEVHFGTATEFYKPKRKRRVSK
jgi:dihydrolipoamide dehydrogenase